MLDEGRQRVWFISLFSLFYLFVRFALKSIKSIVSSGMESSCLVSGP